MKQNVIKGILVTAMIVLSVFISLVSFRYISFEQTGLITNKVPELRTSIFWLIAFYLHVLPGSLALLIGGPQFIGKLRDKFTGLHKTIGKIYVVSVFVASVAGFALAFFADGGIAAKAGFTGLALLWFYSNFRAYTAIRRVDITEHRSWMIRNFALTFAAVTLRLWLPLFLAGFGMKFNTAYPIISWLCWVPNILVAEILVRKFERPAILAGQPEEAAA